MNALSLVKLLGGLGLFIYGMLTMGNALEKMAGEKLEKTLETVTGNIFSAVAVGALITGIIQSSSATTVMVVGFVNAGIMNLKQAVGVIMGANIGTTVTAQILRLDTTGSVSESFLMTLMKPSNLAYVAVAIGAVLFMFSKKRKHHDFGEILLGFGVLFIGMSVMEGSVTALKDLPWFQEMFSKFSNPLLGMLVGVFVTAIIQSSSASVGILQAVASTGAITYSAAIPIILGQNIGTCVTALLSSIGANKSAKRAAMIHFYFNLIGSLLFMTAIYSINAFVGFSFWHETIGKGGIANFHLLFNVVTTLFFIPFNRFLIFLAEHTIKSKNSGEESLTEDLGRLDERFYSSPVVALEQCNKVIVAMGLCAQKNIRIVNAALVSDEAPRLDTFKDNESFLDRAEARLNTYMLGIKDEELSEKSKKAYSEMMHSIGDFERMGDYAENLLEFYQDMKDRNIVFSQEALSELRVMSDAVDEIMDLTIRAYETCDTALSRQIDPLEDVIDSMKEALKSRHIMRLQSGMCTVSTGIPFLDIIHNYEKIADHCSNVSVYVMMLSDDAEEFDMHEYRKIVKDIRTDEFAAFTSLYENKYLSKVI
ncbi:Na/Pi cotransporter family protein [Acidaminobacterium chupaoyuni]